MMKERIQTVIMVVFLVLVAVGMFSFHVITGNVVLGGDNDDVEIVVEDFRIDNSSQVNEEVDLNDTQNISGPK